MKSKKTAKVLPRPRGGKDSSALRPAEMGRLLWQFCATPGSVWKTPFLRLQMVPVEK